MNPGAKCVLLSVSILLMIGIVMIYSSSAVYAHTTFGDSMYFLKRHVFFLILGLAGALFCMSVPAKSFQDHARIIMFGSLLCLLVVLIPGIGAQAGGARRWIRMFGFGFQPSEIAKLALIIYLADFSARKRYEMNRLKQGFFPAISVISFTGMLVLLEPDLGTAIAVGFIGMAILFVSGARIRHLASLAAGAVPILWFTIICAPYRLKRIITFFNPWEDPQGTGFQLIQSFIALGSGGAFGVGLGASKQRLFYLPQSHTDFIYSIIGEELGFWGTTLVLVLFALLVWHALRLALKLREPFASRVILGIGMMIAFEVVVNIGVSAGVIPTKGLPLPFISYGGSSLVIHLAAIGMLLNLSREVE